ncbi:Oidioi.mRNA.OKI2018_I69.chr1.g463.t1.cds [Oikopleura dioica]|uniref:Oidioi.mRNA.OKI2018_I69.chr1.g463.t1.cds n=1 Tax=Oikopleura dioica TaxID=34765 RepID=A0ABN7SS43_OIKDI|nr:Oidioi.mRNA.OKI2018_I69.chr1.g463.t1.cds [Oikopleura dioica]
MAGEVKVVPLDDCWIGMLIEKMGKSENMARSEAICLGVMNNIPIDDTCSIRGLTVAHKVYDSEIMRSAFANIVSKKFKCDEQRLKNTEARIGKLRDEKKNAWKENFKSFKGVNYDVPNLL